MGIGLTQLLEGWGNAGPRSQVKSADSQVNGRGSDSVGGVGAQ